VIIKPVLETNSRIIILTRTGHEKTIMETNIPPAFSGERRESNHGIDTAPLDPPT